MGSTRNCAVFGCSMTYNKAKKLGKNIKFYAFPNRPWMKERKLKWIRFVRRIGLDGKPWEPTSSSLICSQHFIGGSKSEDPRSPSYNPTIFKIIEANNVSSVQQQRYQRLIARNQGNTIVDQNNCSITGKDKLKRHDQEKDTDTKESYAVNQSKNDSYQDHCIPVDKPAAESMLQDKSVQTEGHKSVLDKIIGPNNRSVGFYGFSTLTQAGARSMTGISSNIFALLKSLFPNCAHRHGELQLDDRLLLSLFKLKTGLPFTTIGVLFGISSQHASRTFFNFIDHIKAATKDWIFLPSQHAVRQTMPHAFKANYSRCRIIIDCTEFRTEKPPTIEQQVQMYSNYKSGYTAKYLVGITPAGLISFVSCGYGGRATDSFITNDCGVLNLLEEGDVILADKGFPAIHVKNNSVLVMPPFGKRNQQQFPEEDMALTYNIASVRIHVERAIQRIKTFEIMTKIIPIELLSRFDAIMHVVCVLVNLSSPIIQGDHNLY